ncbi:Protease 2 [Morus notabilis]|uniref:Prolyl endopeptidase n=1 Tax=Morus notabilis TaxID=981085 RepID=W9QNR4_9ROSA|nr:Protease 2 [Morus notabilis]
MGLPALFRPKLSIKTTSFSLPFYFFSDAFSSRFSSFCRRRHFPQPKQVSLPPPPIPKKIPFQVSAHGITWQDPYHWMSNTNDPDLSDYLRRENSYAEAFMADTHKLQRKLFSEMTSRMPAKISTPPERWGPWLYYQFIPEGKEYPVLYRRSGVEESNWVKTILRYAKRDVGREEILLDWNEIAEQYGYVHVGTCRVSPDHNYLAYTLDVTGSEQFMLQVKDLRSGCIIPKLQVHRVVSLAWAQDSNTLFYTLSDDNQRPFRVLYSKVESNDTDGIPLFTESDSSFCIDMTSTKDGKFITVYIIEAANPSGGLQKIRERVSGVQYFLEHHHGVFYILTNVPLCGNKEWSGENYYLVRCPVEDIQSVNWQNIILPRKDFTIQDMDIFDGFLVLFLSKKGNPTFCSINLPVNIECEHQLEIGELNPWFFPLPSSSCAVTPGSNHDFMTSIFHVVLSSPVMPDIIVNYDMSKRRFSIVQQEEVTGVSCEQDTEPIFGSNHDKEENVQYNESQRWKDFSNSYCCETKEVISQDGTRVPLTILYSRTAWQKGQSPGLLQGYGAYGEVLDKSWCTHRLSLLDRGWVVAFADVRGGGGDSSWHKSGSGLYKQNSIDDFVSCANYLISENFVHRHLLSTIGYSAGSLLLGAAINMCPDLFRAAILKVPFLDICNTLLDDNLPLTVLDYEEFGNPQIESQFECIHSYSPYDNISKGSCYPPMLVTTSLNDSRQIPSQVGVWEAAKWVARVRESTCHACSGSVILKTNMSGGHFGEGGRYAQCGETAYEYAFLLKAMGMSNDDK